MTARVKAACRRLGPAALGLLLAACVLAAPVLTVRRQEARLLDGPQPRQSAGSLFWSPAVQQNPFLYALHRACLLGELFTPGSGGGMLQPFDMQTGLLDTALDKLGELHAAGLLDGESLAQCRLALEAALAQPSESERPLPDSALESRLLCTAADSAVQGLSLSVYGLPQETPGPDGLQSVWFTLDLLWLREDGHVVFCSLEPFGERFGDAPAVPDAGAWARYLGLDGFEDWQEMRVEEFSAAYPLLPNYGPHLLSAQAGVHLTVEGFDGGLTLMCGSLLGP